MSLSNLKLVPASLSPADNVNRRTASDPLMSKANGNGVSHSGLSPQAPTTAEPSGTSLHDENIPETQKALEKLSLRAKYVQDALVVDLEDSRKELKIMESLMTMMRVDNADSRFASDILGRLKRQIESRLARGVTVMQRMEEDKGSVRAMLEDLGVKNLPGL